MPLSQSFEGFIIRERLSLSRDILCAQLGLAGLLMQAGKITEACRTSSRPDAETDSFQRLGIDLRCFTATSDAMTVEMEDRRLLKN